VLGTATALTGSDFPASFPQRGELFRDDEWINPATPW
jgi:nitrilase